MYLLEIENFGTGSKSIIYARDKEEMHKTLIEKGFDCMIKYNLYAGFDSDKNEIGVTIANIPHVGYVKNLKG